MSLAVIHDLSLNGLIINGKHRTPLPQVTMNGRRVGSRAFILLPEDTVQFPGNPGELAA